MKLYVDLETLQLIEGPGFRSPVSLIRFKRGDAALLEVSFLASGLPPSSIGDPTALELTFGVKLRNAYAADYLVSTTGWTIPAEEDEQVYRCSPSFNTEALDDALGVGGESEASEITLMGEITWREGTGLPTSTRTFLVVVENDVNRGTEGTPLPLPTPDNWLDARAVRHDSAQSLSEAGKLLARTNIGTGSGSDDYATTRFFNAGELAEGDVVVIDGTEYTLTYTPAGPGDVLADEGMQPLIDAINGNDAHNAPHPTVTASDAGGGDMMIQARVRGPVGNGIVVDFWPAAGASAYWEEGNTIGGMNRLFADVMGGSGRLENDAEIEAVSGGFLLVQKNQGNVRHVSFSLFRLWSWIRSKMNGALTLAGTKSFTGQVELTGQSATNPTSAMTRDLGDARFGRRPVVLDADFTIVNDAVGQNITMAPANHPEGLSVFGFSLAANEAVTFTVIMRVDETTTTRNQVFLLTLPAGAAHMTQVQATASGSPTVYHYGSNTGTVPNYVASTTVDGIVTIHGWIGNASTPGTFILGIRQLASSAVPITIRRGSSITVNRP